MRPPDDEVVFLRLNQIAPVSRETFERLKIYQELLIRWQQRINLVSRDTLPQFWERHIADSLQLFSLAKDSAGLVLDMGSGAGFPGMVLAIAGCHSVHLVDSDQKKCIFLNEVNRLTKAEAVIHCIRIESLISPSASLIISRACAPLHQLLAWSEPFVSRETRCVFLKGKNYPQELLDAKVDWLFDYTTTSSITDASGVILQLSQIRRKGL